MLKYGKLTTPLDGQKTFSYDANLSIADIVAQQVPAGSPVVVRVTRPSDDGETSGYVLKENWHYVLDDNEELELRQVVGDPISIAIGAIVGAIKGIVAATSALLATQVSIFGFATTLGVALKTTIGLASIGIGLFQQLKSARGSRGVADRDPIEVSPTYNIQAQGNAARIGEAMPRLYGRHIIYPDYGALPYNENAANQQLLRQLFIVSLGKVQIHQIRIGDVVLWDETTGLTDTFEGVQLFFYPPNTAIDTFPKRVETSELVGGQELTGPTTGDYIGNFPACASGERITLIGVDIAFPNGIYQFDTGNGNFLPVTLQVRTQARLIDDAGVAVGSWFDLGVDSTTAGSPQPLRKTMYYGVDSGRYEVRMRRETDKNPDTNVGNTITWQGMRGITQGANIFPDATSFVLNIQASEQLTEQSQNKVNVIATSILPTYNTETEEWADAITDNPAWVMADILRDTTYGAGLADSQIDLVELARLADVYTARGDTFNAIFDGRTSVQAALDDVGAACRTKPMQVGGVVTFIRDEPQGLARSVITPLNMVADSLSITSVFNGEETADAIVVEYLDEDTWRPNEVLCQLPSYSTDNPARIKLFGVTNHAQAWREGMHIIAANRYRRTVVSVDTELEGQVLLPAQVVRLTHHVPFFNQHASVVERSGNILIFDRPLRWDSVAQHFINVKRTDGSQWGAVEVSQGSTPATAIMDSTSLATIEGAQGDLDDFLNTDDPDTQPTVIEFYAAGVDTGGYKVKAISNRDVYTSTLVMVNDHPSVYGVDEGTPPSKTASQDAGRTPDRPLLTGLRFNRLVPTLQEENTTPVLLEWNDTAGALFYIIEYSLDSGQSWTRLFTGVGNSVQANLPQGVLSLRGKAVGRLHGAWVYDTRTIGEALRMTEDGLAAKVTEDAVSAHTIEVL